MTTKVAASPFSAHPTSAPEKARSSCLQTTWAALSVIPFLSPFRSCWGQSEPSEWENAKLVCKIWNLCAKQSLKLYFESRHHLNSASFRDCRPFGLNTDRLACTKLHRLDLISFDVFRQKEPQQDSIYSVLSPSSLGSLLSKASNLRYVTLDRPSLQLLNQIVLTCPMLETLDVNLRAYLNPRQRQNTYEQIDVFFLNLKPVCTQISCLILKDAAVLDFQLDCLPYLLIPMLPSLKILKLQHSSLNQRMNQAISRSNITHLELFHTDETSHISLATLTHLRIDEDEENDSDFDDSNLLDYWVTRLKGSPYLISLEIGGDNRITDEILEQIPIHCPLLTHLGLELEQSDPRQKSDHMAQMMGIRIKKEAQDLLTLQGYRTVLAGCTHLTSLDLTHRKISAEALDTLRKEYPGINIKR